MRIVDRTTFLALPAGTVFAKYAPQYFDELAIKGETSGPDFYVQQLVPWFEGAEDDASYSEAINAIMNGQPSPPLDYHCEARDGLFDDDQLFAVFDELDLSALIARLQEAAETASSSLR